MAKFNDDLRKRFINRKDELAREPVEFMGEALWAWELTGRQRANVEQARYQVNSRTVAVTPNLTKERATVVMYGLRDGDGADALRVFADGDDDHYLNELPSSSLDRAYEIIVRLSGMRKADAEEAEKNSATPRSDASSTDSPNGSDGAASNGALPASAAAN